MEGESNWYCVFSTRYAPYFL